MLLIHFLNRFLLFRVIDVTAANGLSLNDNRRQNGQRCFQRLS